MNATAGSLAGLLALASALAVRSAAAGHRRRLVAHRLVRGPVASGISVVNTAGALRPPEWLQRKLTSAGVDGDAGRVWVRWVVVTGSSAVGSAMVGGPGLAAVVVVGLVVGPAAVLGAASGRAERLLEEALPGALEAVARGLRSGTSLVQAIGEAATVTPGRLGSELRAITSAVGNGEALVTAIDGWGERHALAGVRLAVSALGLGAETGGAHARAIDGVAATIRSRLAVSREVRALSSQARLSGVVIALAPIGFAVLAAATDERTATFLLATPLGLVCLAAGLGLDGLAALWMHRLARVEQ